MHASADLFGDTTIYKKIYFFIPSISKKGLQGLQGLQMIHSQSYAVIILYIFYIFSYLKW